MYVCMKLKIIIIIIRYELEFLAKQWLNKSLFVICVLFKIILFYGKRHKFVREKKGKKEER